jgi:hypothetical protein
MVNPLWSAINGTSKRDAWRRRTIAMKEVTFASGASLGAECITSMHPLFEPLLKSIGSKSNPAQLEIVWHQELTHQGFTIDEGRMLLSTKQPGVVVCRVEACMQYVDKLYAVVHEYEKFADGASYHHTEDGLMYVKEEMMKPPFVLLPLENDSSLIGACHTACSFGEGLYVVACEGVTTGDLLVLVNKV